MTHGQTDAGGPRRLDLRYDEMGALVGYESMADLPPGVYWLYSQEAPAAYYMNSGQAVARLAKVYGGALEEIAKLPPQFDDTPLRVIDRMRKIARDAISADVGATVSTRTDYAAKYAQFTQRAYGPERDGAGRARPVCKCGHFWSRHLVEQGAQGFGECSIYHCGCRRYFAHDLEDIDV